MKCAFPDDGPCYYRFPQNECIRGKEKCLHIYRHQKNNQKNSEQIDNTSYYKLPCGKYLEDYIFHKGLNFAEGSALKYMWRAGSKDGESENKDNDKCKHYCKFLAIHGAVDVESVVSEVERWRDEATTWDGNIASIKLNLASTKSNLASIKPKE